jgi:hypothetical protein
MTTPFKTALLILALATSIPFSRAAEKFNQLDFQAKASFELNVDKSKYLKPGASKIQSQSAFVSLAHDLLPGKSDGLEVLFFTKPVTEALLPDLLNNDAKELKKSDYAALVLFLDKQNKVSQVNLTFVVPGTTVARTVAWRPDDLKNYFSQANFNGRRLVLKSKGTYSDSDSDESLKLSWDIDLDLPVIREVKR